MMKIYSILEKNNWFSKGNEVHKYGGLLAPNAFKAVL